MSNLEEQKPVQPAQEAAETTTTDVSRRDFIKRAGVTTAAVFAGTAYGALGTNFAHAQGQQRIKVGWIGCGGRGHGAVRQNLEAAPEMLLWSVGDVFPKARGQRDGLKNDAKYKDKVDCPDERCFEGFDAYKGVIDSGVDLIVHATPPGFRPEHIHYAVSKGRHVFAEKPFGVDAAGVKLCMEAAKIADAKKLSVVPGTQRRHTQSYIQTVRRLREEKAIGDIVSGQCYWNQGLLWDNGDRDAKNPDGSPKFKNDMEWQLKQWYYFTWICGDHIVEQHVHNLDVINWVIGAPPVAASGMGGRQVRVEPRFGHIYDHFATEYEYPGGVKVLSFCRHQNNTEGKETQMVQGTKGVSYPHGEIQLYGETTKWRAPGGGRDGMAQEHIDLVTAIKEGKPLNECQRMAESTLTAIMGREASYTGKRVNWNQLLDSDQKLFQAKLEWGPLPVPEVARPGRTMVKRVDISQEMIDALKAGGAK
jgi:myo-inositol 2-dehydrogenase / D-chiro-inositol 1-dehydrogenase